MPYYICYTYEKSLLTKLYKEVNVINIPRLEKGKFTEINVLKNAKYYKILINYNYNKVYFVYFFNAGLKIKTNTLKSHISNFNVEVLLYSESALIKTFNITIYSLNSWININLNE